MKPLKADIDGKCDESSGELVCDFLHLSEPAFQKIWDNPLDADYDKL